MELDRATFEERMQAVDDALRGGDAAGALAGAQALRAELSATPEHLAWSTYYALRALHALGRWDAVVDLMRAEGGRVTALGSRNVAFACALAMEAAHEAGDIEAVVALAIFAVRSRSDHEAAAVGLVFETAEDLLRRAARPDLWLALTETMIDAVPALLSAQLQRWALDAAAALSDREALERSLERAVARRARWPALARLRDSGAAELLVELYASPWFLARLPADERARALLGARAYQAATDGDVDAVGAALEAAGDPNLTDAAGRTALSGAAWAGQTGVVVALAGRPGVDLDRANLHGRAPLHLAAARGHRSAVKRLLTAGAAADLRDIDGQTPLILAARAGRLAVATTLLLGGADPTVHDAHGLTAAGWAAREGHIKLLAKLEGP